MKKVWGVGRIFALLVVMLISSAVVAYFLPQYSFEITLFLAIVGIVVVVFSLLGLHANIGKIISGVSKGISTAQSKALSELRVPVLITTHDGEIVWYNPAFEDTVSEASMMVGKTLVEGFGTDVSHDM